MILALEIIRMLVGMAWLGLYLDAKVDITLERRRIPLTGPRYTRNFRRRKNDY